MCSWEMAIQWTVWGEVCSLLSDIVVCVYIYMYVCPLNQTLCSVHFILDSNLVWRGLKLWIKHDVLERAMQHGLILNVWDKCSCQWLFTHPLSIVRPPWVLWGFTFMPEPRVSRSPKSRPSLQAYRHSTTLWGSTLPGRTVTPDNRPW